MAKIDELITAVGEESTVVDGVVTMLDQIIADLKAAGTPAQISAAIATLQANKQKLADAIARGTAADAEVNPPAAPPTP